MLLRAFQQLEPAIKEATNTFNIQRDVAKESITDLQRVFAGPIFEKAKKELSRFNAALSENNARLGDAADALGVLEVKVYDGIERVLGVLVGDMSLPDVIDYVELEATRLGLAIEDLAAVLSHVINTIQLMGLGARTMQKLAISPWRFAAEVFAKEQAVLLRTPESMARARKILAWAGDSTSSASGDSGGTGHFLDYVGNYTNRANAAIAQRQRERAMVPFYEIPLTAGLEDAVKTGIETARPQKVEVKVDANAITWGDNYSVALSIQGAIEQAFEQLGDAPRSSRYALR